MQTRTRPPTTRPIITGVERPFVGVSPGPGCAFTDGLLASPRPFSSWDAAPTEHFVFVSSRLMALILTWLQSVKIMSGMFRDWRVLMSDTQLALMCVVMYVKTSPPLSDTPKFWNSFFLASGLSLTFSAIIFEIKAMLSAVSHSIVVDVEMFPHSSVASVQPVATMLSILHVRSLCSVDLQTTSTVLVGGFTRACKILLNTCDISFVLCTALQGVRLKPSARAPTPVVLRPPSSSLIVTPTCNGTWVLFFYYPYGTSVV